MYPVVFISSHGSEDRVSYKCMYTWVRGQSFIQVHVYIRVGRSVRMPIAKGLGRNSQKMPIEN